MNSFDKKVPALVCLLILIISSFPAYAEFVIEMDALNAALRVSKRTTLDQIWISPGVTVTENVLLRAEFYRSGGEGGFSSGYSQTGGGVQVGTNSVETAMLGLSAGYCFSTCTSDSFRLIAGIGQSERKFSDSVLGSETSRGAAWLAEIGYQWVWGNAMTSFSWAHVYSDVKSSAQFSTATSNLTISRSSAEDALKWAIGFYF